MKRNRRGGHFILGRVLHDDGHVRITRGERFVVGGGTRETHEQAADFVSEVDREMSKNPPETPGEMGMIVREAARKAGLETGSGPKKG